MYLTPFVTLLLLVACESSQLWNEYTIRFNKKYSSEAEAAKRQECFHKNVELIGEVQKMDNMASYGLNVFTDLCAEEFKSYHNLQIKPRKRNFIPFVDKAIAARAAADSVDWRQKGAVVGVKNQGQCGSCWAFSAIGNMEGQHFLSTGKLVSLSEEELVQCSNPTNDPNGNQGCNGGLMDNAFDWVVKNGGIDSEEDYPYTSGAGTTGTCISSKLKNIVANFSGHTDIPQDEDQMAAFVEKNGPLSVAVDAGLFWQLYTGGVKTTCTAGQLDHGVLIVGYGTDNAVPYWIIKNSWGGVWGESGYIRLKRGVNCNGVKEAASSINI